MLGVAVGDDETVIPGVNLGTGPDLPTDPVERTQLLLERSGGRRVIVGVAGKPGAGKTTLVSTLACALGEIAVVVPMDGFHLGDTVLDQLGRRDRKGAPDTFDAAGYAALLTRLRQETGTVYAPGFERDLEQPIAQSIMVTPRHRIILTEGNYLLLERPAWSAVRRHLDEVWWVSTDETQRRTRLVARHVQFGKAPTAAEEWVARVDDTNAALVADGADRADLVLSR